MPREKFFATTTETCTECPERLMVNFVREGLSDEKSTVRLAIVKEFNGKLREVRWTTDKRLVICMKTRSRSEDPLLSKEIFQFVINPWQP